MRPVGIIILPFVLAGCWGDDDTGGGGDAGDGSGDQADGSSADAAAGGDGGGDPDGAAAPDAAIDGVLVRVSYLGGPVTGAPVLFHDSAGRLLERLETDQAGEVLADVPDGSSVTALVAPGQLSTVQEVGRGDVIQMGRFHFRLSDGTMTVSLPPARAGQFYGLQSACSRPASSPNPNLTIAVLPCEAATVPLMAELSESQRITGYILVPPARITPGGHLDVSGPWLDPVERTIRVTNAPSRVDTVRAIGQVHVAGAFVHGWTELLGSPSRGSLTHSFPAAALGDESVTTVILCDQSDPGTECQEVRRIDPGPEVALDVAAEIIPWVDGRLEWAGDLAVSLEWTQDGTRPYDGAHIRLELRDVEEAVTGRWEVVAPPGRQANILTLPPLPADLEGNWPYPDASGAEFEINVLEVAADDGYDEFRRHAASDAPIAGEVRRSQDRSQGFGR